MKYKKIVGNYFGLIVVLLFLPYFAGCASFTCRTGDCSPISPGIYSGVRFNIYESKILIRGDPDELNPIYGARYLFLAFCILDTPLSFMVDTILLPYDIFQFRKKNDELQKQNDNNISQVSDVEASP